MLQLICSHSNAISLIIDGSSIVPLDMVPTNDSNYLFQVFLAFYLYPQSKE